MIRKLYSSLYITNKYGAHMKLLVRNLTRTITEDELRSMFESYGTVQSCSLVIDKATGNSKGFAFVEMPRQGDAKAAMISLNGKNVGGNKIRVKKAESKPGAGKSHNERTDD
jgi:RNA recognition motif-containing protein